MSTPIPGGSSIDLGDRRPADVLAEIEALARVWAGQSTDYDDDTEQQIADGKKLLRLLGCTVCTGDQGCPIETHRYGRHCDECDPVGRCLCDGGAYEVQAYPLLTHPDCRRAHRRRCPCHPSRHQEHVLAEYDTGPHSSADQVDRISDES